MITEGCSTQTLRDLNGSGLAASLKQTQGMVAV